MNSSLTFKCCSNFSLGYLRTDSNCWLRSRCNHEAEEALRVARLSDHQVFDGDKQLHKVRHIVNPATSLARSTSLTNCNSINLTKLDVLDGFSEVKVAVAYKLDGQLLPTFPGTQVQ
jgi:Adenylosuccinate synthetase